MSFYRANNVSVVKATNTGSLSNSWGILPVSGSTGVLRLQPTTLGGSTFTSMSIADLTPGVPFHCFVRSVEVSAGTVYILA